MWSTDWMPWMLFVPVMMLVFLAVCVAGLRERYAPGEIDQP
jgi:hypothetical protein